MPRRPSGSRRGDLLPAPPAVCGSRHGPVQQRGVGLLRARRGQRARLAAGAPEFLPAEPALRGASGSIARSISGSGAEHVSHVRPASALTSRMPRAWARRVSNLRPLACEAWRSPRISAPKYLQTSRNDRDRGCPTTGLIRPNTARFGPTNGPTARYARDTRRVQVTHATVEIAAACIGAAPRRIVKSREVV